MLQQSVENCTAYLTVHALCLVDPTLAFRVLQDEHCEEGRQSAFQKAAATGTTTLLQIMITELKSLLEDHQNAESEMLEWMSQQYGGKTAFRMAADNLRLGVLEVLSSKYPSLADSGTVISIISKTGPRHQQSVQDDALRAFKLVLAARGSEDSKLIWEEAVETPSRAVVDHLLNGPGADEFATFDNARFVIEKGTGEMWMMFKKEDREAFMSQPNCKLLHTAVSTGKADIVAAILAEFPDHLDIHIGKGDQSAHPLQHLMDKGRDASGYSAIPDMLLNTMIKSPNLELASIGRLLAQPKVAANPMGLNLSSINTGELTFADYVEVLKSQETGPGSIYRFESILRLVNFPDLSTDKPPQTAKEWQIDHMEVADVIQWLKKAGVTTVLDLTVLDRLHCPHSDEVVASCVNGLGVRHLNWRKLNLYLGYLFPNQAEDRKELRELHLYSSGSRAVHDRWCEHLPYFYNLRKLHITVVDDVLSAERAIKITEDLRTRMGTLREDWSSLTRERRFLDVDCQGVKEADANAQGELDVLVTQRKWAVDRGVDILLDSHEGPSDIVGPSLYKFLKSFKAYHVKHKGTAGTKVALIDSGVVVYGGKASTDHRYGTDLAQRIVAGTSVVNRHNADAVFWHASEPHGTQMARLICSINPCCDLYVIKVVENRNDGVTASNVADAIDWAREQGVDVISLSLTTRGEGEEIYRDALRRAKDDDIVVLVSTADRGLRMAELAKDSEVEDEVLSIVACDTNGHLLQQSQPEGYDFRFLGSVHSDPVPFLCSSGQIHGSSVATALAAGTASLSLACCRISERCEPKWQWRCRTVRKTFKSMSRGVAHNVPWVDLEKFCNASDELLEAFQFEGLVDKYFKS